MSYYVVQTEPLREATVQRRLVRIGLEAYWPKIRLVTERVVSLFPSYLFVNECSRWYDIRSTMGVRALLMSGDHPATLPEVAIADIRNRETNGIVKLPNKPTSRFRIGQKVYITRGPFRDRIAVYAGMSSRDRERVLIEALGRALTIELPTRDIVGGVR